MTELGLVYGLVRGQSITLVIEDSETGARAEVIGTVAEVTRAGTVNMVDHVLVRGRARQLTAAWPESAS